ncbi:MAG: MBL fold metallo-hydrolase [Bacteroidales bacterium]|nr:MAG: MBL fold metallo-hydrolase [Bacteroidales bacterium]
MIQVKKLILNPFQENTYIVYDQTGEALIIDPGCFAQSEIDEVKWFVDSNGLTVKQIILTHGHIDHILGVDSLRDLYKVKCLAHDNDLPLIEASPKLGQMYGLTFDKAPKIDAFIKDGDRIPIGESIIEVIHTPGHSMGGVCFFLRNEKILFTGDTLFNGSIGRTDLPGGNFEVLIASISQKIIPLGEGVTVYPGHGNSTTIGFEKQNNPFLQKG